MIIDSDPKENLLKSGSNPLKNYKKGSVGDEKSDVKEYDENFYKEKVQISALKASSHEEFMKSLHLDTTAEKARIDKEMNYLLKTFEDCGFLIEYQDNYVHEIDKSLKQAEKNSEDLIKTLKNNSSKVNCQQKILTSIIIALCVFIIILFVLAFIKS